MGTLTVGCSPRQILDRCFVSGVVQPHRMRRPACTHAYAICTTCRIGILHVETNQEQSIQWTAVTVLLAGPILHIETFPVRTEAISETLKLLR
jgi:hypothetical protein